MLNKDKIILDLCGGTGAWGRPYLEAGYDIRNITLPEYDVQTYKPPENVYGILAAPPCTMFSIARNENTAKRKRDLREGMELVIACLNIIWGCRYKNKLAFWCLENPRGFLRQLLGKPFFTFKAYEYGDLWVKPTDLWGYFKAPRKKPIGSLLKPLIDRDRIKVSLVNLNYHTRKEARAITPPGFARAFYEANR